MDPALLNSTTFKLIHTGIREDIPRDKVCFALADLLKANSSSIDRLLARLPYVLKKNIRADQAVRYKTAIENAGGFCCIEKDDFDVAVAIKVPSPIPVGVKLQAAPTLDGSTPIVNPRSPEIHPRDLVSKGPMAGISRKIVVAVKKFFLLDIPERSVALNFKLPSPSTRANPPGLATRVGMVRRAPA